MARPLDFSGLPAKTSAGFDSVNYGVAVQGLSDEQLDLLNKCRHDGSAFGEPPTTPKLRTGHITVEELIGGKGNDASNIPIMERLKISRPVMRKAVFDAAGEHVPLVPGFPIPMRTQNRGDMGLTSTMFRPELFKTTMEAYGSANQKQQQSGSDVTCMLHLFKGVSSAMNKGKRKFRLRMSMRNERSKPKFPHSTQKVSQMRSNGPHRGGYGGQHANRGTSSNNAFESHSGTNQGQNQKAKKPYFMPYFYPDDVKRGLGDPQSKLVEGVLRVNQRNYEESYIDNPEGDLDLLILGVHDRNRALHGDLVVVRIKERENWVVLEGPYKAWRESHQSKEANKEEKKIVEQNESSMFNVTGLSVSASSLTEPVPISQSMCYSRTNLIRVAVQMEMATPKPTDTQKTRLALKPDIQTMLANLGINKSDDVDSDPTSLRRLSSSQPVVKKSPNGTGSQNKRSSMRTLADLPEDSKIVPDSCLQKTAEV
ncbi:unnamed protein product, partial [Mesorhabditis belari]|uniref:Rrp44-like cold shock domain-containing protein n=1 Tax=Mesorhabditis belari TaxID=2138241 RepID=A0AAF3F297_9BILA